MKTHSHSSAEFEPDSIISKYLLPMLSGAAIEKPRHELTGREMSSKKLVVEHGSRTRYRIRLRQTDKIAVVMRREQEFQPDEIKLMSAFANKCSEILSRASYQDVEILILKSLPEVVSEFVAGSESNAVAQMIDVCEYWSVHTYEGQNIVTAFGLDPENEGEGDSIDEMRDKDFVKVVCNGYDTMAVCNKFGQLVGFIALDVDDASGVLAPYRFGIISKWASAGKVAVVLNRNGEILIFADGELKFAKRRGAWRYFNHSLAIQRMANGTKSWKDDLRRAVYLICLDLAFNKHGGCLGLLENGGVERCSEIVNGDDVLAARNSQKSRVMSVVSSGKSIQELDRRLKAELSSVDGAVVVDNVGNIHAVGAILKIKSGSEGGARTAAAKALALYGIGVKVSSDGYIRIYGRKKDVKGKLYVRQIIEIG